LAQCIETSTVADLDGLLTGERLLRVGGDFHNRMRPTKSKKPCLISQDWTATADRLRTLPSREEGHRLIEGLSKVDLTQLARAMNLPVTKEDNTDRLRQKIIESGIGSRLVSQAIRGE
jgi:hypothetical protein